MWQNLSKLLTSAVLTAGERSVESSRTGAPFRGSPCVTICPPLSRWVILCLVDPFDDGADWQPRVRLPSGVRGLPQFVDRGSSDHPVRDVFCDGTSAFGQRGPLQRAVTSGASGEEGMGSWLWDRVGPSGRGEASLRNTLFLKNVPGEMPEGGIRWSVVFRVIFGEPALSGGLVAPFRGRRDLQSSRAGLES